MNMNNKLKINNLSKVESYIEGTLTQKEIDELWIEFLKDPQLHEYFITEIHLQSLRKKGELPPGFSKPGQNKVTEQPRAYNVWKYAAAAIILLVASLQMFRFEESSEGTFAALSIADINLSELAGADIYRSENHAGRGTDITINEGLALAYENNTNLAIDTFRSLLDAELAPEQQIRVELNLGILSYNRGDYQEAATHFMSVTELEEMQGALAEKAWWFLGNSLLQAGDIAGAREAFLYTYSIDGRFQNDASELIEKLDDHSVKYPG